MPENFPGSMAESFPAELRSFWTLCLLSLALGVLAITFGLLSIVDAVLAMAGEGIFGIFRLVQAFAGWAAAVIGVRWVIPGARILSMVSGILGEYQALEGSAGGEAREDAPAGTESAAGATYPGSVDALVLRMMAHYRENWKTWWKMGLIPAVGGWVFICLGVLDFIDGYPAWQAGGGPGLPFLAGGIAIALGVAAILVSRRFREYARNWEHRLIDAGYGDEILPEEGEQGKT